MKCGSQQYDNNNISSEVAGVYDWRWSSGLFAIDCNKKYKSGIRDLIALFFLIWL